jgi:surfactin synthase thioesterase subunit
MIDDHRLAAHLASYGGLPGDVLSRPEWVGLLMPTVRDDLRIVQSFRPTDEPPLPCPLYIVGGYDDPLVSPDALAAWSTLSALPQPVRLYRGGHFLFHSPEPALVAAIARIAVNPAGHRSLY